MPAIYVEKLVKEYKRRVRATGENDGPNKGRGFLKRGFLFGPQTVIKAVDNISFSIDEGEIVGYIGPNGAGKSTTIKMLTGILVPTRGRIEVNGVDPYKNRKKNAMNIGVVFGQRTQLWWDLPVMDSLKLLKYIYDIPQRVFSQNLEEFKEILDIGQFLDAPVRQLSLGQRMRADIAAALLHNPGILFMDEPTIGLDPVAKGKMRDFIRRINKERNVTVILTTHDMSDIEELCRRIAIIDKGKLVYDGTLEAIREKYGKERVLIVDFEKEEVLLPPQATLVKDEDRRKWLSFDGNEISASRMISLLAEQNDMVDLSIKEVNIEEIIRKLYTDHWEGRVQQ